MIISTGPLKLFLIVSISILILSFIVTQETFARPVDNMRVVDIYGNSIIQAKAGQQIQISRDLSWYIYPTYFLSLDDPCPYPTTTKGDEPNCGTPTGYTFSSGRPIYWNGKELPFVNIVQISNSNNEVVHLSWNEGNIRLGEAFTLDIPWTPIEAGEYAVTSFVWKSFDEPISYTSPVSLSFLVL